MSLIYVNDGIIAARWQIPWIS